MAFWIYGLGLRVPCIHERTVRSDTKTCRSFKMPCKAEAVKPRSSINFFKSFANIHTKYQMSAGLSSLGLLTYARKGATMCQVKKGYF